MPRRAIRTQSANEMSHVTKRRNNLLRSPQNALLFVALLFVTLSSCVLCSCAKAPLERYQGFEKIQAWTCQARFRATGSLASGHGSLRGSLRAELRTNHSHAHILLSDPFMNPVAKIVFQRGDISVTSESAREIKQFLNNFPKKQWWLWLSFVLGKPVADSRAPVLADGLGDPVEMTMGPVKTVCDYDRKASRHPQSCRSEWDNQALQMNFTFVDCQPSLH